MFGVPFLDDFQPFATCCWYCGRHFTQTQPHLQCAFCSTLCFKHWNATYPILGPAKTEEVLEEHRAASTLENEGLVEPRPCKHCGTSFTPSTPANTICPDCRELREREKLLKAQLRAVRQAQKDR